MSYFWFIIICIAFVFILGIYFAFFHFRLSKKHSKKLSSGEVLEFQKILKKISSNISSQEKISDADKLYHKILLAYWYTGTFWDILKQYPNIIHNIDKIWELHKLRNKLAHDFDLMDDIILSKKSKEYIWEIKNLLKNIS